ncbi:hypothetical protein INT45_007116 [Circinella minor]|uniref:Yeast cell wall synthesis Kre9/Knh1-like N-terminal domain-containing protein n=1 Tax=Circinella minor TaxID=1195481 RepID=A0A8H7SAP6_9FUNG|nr:hypothetical protein INT45_007116 [Circinella minor]
MKAFISALVFAIVGTVMVAAQHQPYFITTPTPGEPVKAGTPFDLVWLNGADEQVTIHLLQGNGREGMLPTGTSVKVDGSDGKTKFEIPATSDPKGNYGFRIDYVSDKGRKAHAFSMAFPLENTTGSSSNNDEAKKESAAPSATTSASENANTSKSSDAQESSSAADKNGDDKKEEENDTQEKKKEESPATTATSESQEEKNDEESAAVTFKLAATMIAIPAVVAGAFLA